ncbi:MAG: DegT/DnrJ/EryC1/StrS family aminotransferase [Bacteroidetes bacterium]|nr:DegT/DnrJ/EryC1/StrS family aminotransferase [Bacteroidota bacterium]
MQIPWTKPDFWGNEIKYVTDALESSWISGGTYLDKLENDFKKVLDKKHVLAVSNGTTAIHLAYLGLGLKPNDEVVVPGFSFLAASNIALHMGLKPVFAEVDPDTWCLSPKHLPKYISSKTKAIIPIHTYGNVCNMNKIMRIAKEKKIAVIEDCAESLFSKYKGNYCGSFGNISTFSFQATKTITTGEGGLVATDSEDLNKKMMLYRSHGMDRSKSFYWHEVPGHNFRLTNFQAAMGVAQFEKINVILSERKRVYEEYKKHLTGVDGIVLQKIEKDVDPVIWALALKLHSKNFPQGRDKVIEQLREKGIETRPGFFASSLLKIYKKHSLPICENISRHVLSLPTFPSLKNAEISFVCNELLQLRK